MLLRLLDELGKADFESFRQTGGGVERRVSDASLDHTNISRMKPRALRQLLLRKARS